MIKCKCGQTIGCFIYREEYICPDCLMKDFAAVTSERDEAVELLKKNRFKESILFRLNFFDVEIDIDDETCNIIKRENCIDCGIKAGYGHKPNCFIKKILDNRKEASDARQKN